MSGASKGSSFERNICRQLSMWWTKGIEGKARDDVFWRSSQSGGRATQRAKSGKKTFGSYGDINAVDPVGQPLMRYFTFELKRGRSHGTPACLIDSPRTKKIRPFEAALNQAFDAHTLAESFTWALICKPDRREVMIYLSIARLHQLASNNGLRPPVRYALNINPTGRRFAFAGLLLTDFFKQVRPVDIVDLSKHKISTK